MQPLSISLKSHKMRTVELEILLHHKDLERGYVCVYVCVCTYIYSIERGVSVNMHTIPRILPPFGEVGGCECAMVVVVAPWWSYVREELEGGKEGGDNVGKWLYVCVCVCVYICVRM